MSVYDKEAFEDRVNYAASVISKGILPMNGRYFDTCFEMNDGDFVCAALYRRTLKKPQSKLASNIFRFLSKDRVLAHYEATKQLTRQELKHAAWRNVNNEPRPAK